MYLPTHLSTYLLYLPTFPVLQYSSLVKSLVVAVCSAVKVGLKEERDSKPRLDYILKIKRKNTMGKLDHRFLFLGKSLNKKRVVAAER